MYDGRSAVSQRLPKPLNEGCGHDTHGVVGVADVALFRRWSSSWMAPKSDNRLANGKKAVGTVGAASTGLADGQTEYEANKGRTCPA